MIGTSGLRILVDSQVDYGKNRNQALTAVIFVTGLSGIKVNFGNVQLTGMVLACVTGMILSPVSYTHLSPGTAAPPVSSRSSSPATSRSTGSSLAARNDHL